MAQLIKYKREKLSLVAQHPHKKPGNTVYACNPSPGEAETRELCELANNLVLEIQETPSERPLKQRLRSQGDGSAGETLIVRPDNLSLIFIQPTE